MKQQDADKLRQDWQRLGQRHNSAQFNASMEGFRKSMDEFRVQMVKQQAQITAAFRAAHKLSPKYQRQVDEHHNRDQWMTILMGATLVGSAIALLLGVWIF